MEVRAPQIPAEHVFRMPPETAPHEGTLMAWPCRVELWGDLLASAKAEYAGVANAICGFEPVIMMASSSSDAAEARAMLSAHVEVVELPLDDSWLRDNGPIFTLDATGRRAGVHFRFNAWGEKFLGWDRDERAGRVLAERFGDEVAPAPLVLEGGSVLIDALGRLVTTEQCLLNPNRNPELSRSEIEGALTRYLGATEVLWLDRGLREDRDTDGHVDLIAAFTSAGSLLLQSRPPSDPNHAALAENRRRAEEAGFDIIDFLPLARSHVGGEEITHSYLNLYACNGAVIVPQAGGESSSLDREALDLVSQAFPERHVLGVPALTLAYGGGGPHCITQQIPSRVPPA